MPSVSVDAKTSRVGTVPSAPAKPVAGLLEGHAAEGPIHALEATGYRQRAVRLAEAGAALPATPRLRETLGLNQLAAWASGALPADPGDERRAGLARLSALLDGETARLATAAAAERDLAAGLHATLRLHEALLAGEKLPAAWLEALAGDVRRTQADRAGPAFDLRPRDDRATEFARHALNQARAAMFLSGGAASTELFAAALLMDAPLFARAAAGQRIAAADRDAHPAAAARMLERLGGFAAETLAAVRDHHERLDGAGLRRAAGDVQSALARRFAVAADFAEALAEGNETRAALQRTLRRADAGALDMDEALRLMETGFHAVGSFVELATGEHAEIVATHRLAGDAGLASLPIVRLRRTADGAAPPGFPIWNLAQRPASRVVRALSPVESVAYGDC